MTTTSAPNEIDLDTLRALEQAANPAPWFFNGYSAIFSKTMNDGYDEWVEPLVDANHSLDRSACPPCEGKACQHATEQYHRDPAVAWVPAHHGDTAIDRRVADAQLIEAMRNALPALLDELATYKAEVKHADAEREEAERNRDAAREELAKTRAELDEAQAAAVELAPASLGAQLEQARADLAIVEREREHLRKVLDVANETTAAAQQIVTAALADGTARVNPATMAEPAANLPCHCPDGRRVRYCLVHGEKATAEPAGEPKATVPPAYNLPPKHCGELRVHAPHTDSSTICDGRTLPDAEPAAG